MYFINPNFAGYLFTIITICVSISLGISVFLIPMITQNLDKMNFSGYPDEAKLKEYVRGYFLNNKVFIWHIGSSLILSFVVAFSFMGVENKINEFLSWWIQCLFRLVLCLIFWTIYIVWNTFNKVDKVLIKMNKMDIIIDYLQNIIKQTEKINIFFATCYRFINEKNNGYNFEDYMLFFNKLKDYIIEIDQKDYITTMWFINIVNCVDINVGNKEDPKLRFVDYEYKKNTVSSFVADMIEGILEKMNPNDYFYLYDILNSAYRDNKSDIFHIIVLRLYIKIIINNKLDSVNSYDLNLWNTVSLFGFDNDLFDLFRHPDISDYSLHKLYRLFNVDGGFYKLKEDVIAEYFPFGFDNDIKKALCAYIMVLCWYDNDKNSMKKTYKLNCISKEDRDYICYIYSHITCNYKQSNDDDISWVAKIITNSQSDDKISYVEEFIKDFLNDKDGIITNEITKLNNLDLN